MSNFQRKMIISVFAKQFTVETQTPWNYFDRRTCGTQTSTKFTEKLTDFDTIALSSAEAFDQACNICYLYTEREAVGFCSVCEQYMCYQCCKHHEKISLSQNHNIVGKEDFENVREGRELSDMGLVALLRGKLPKCVDLTCKRYKYRDCSCGSHNSYLLARFSVGRQIYFVLCSSTSFHYGTHIELGCITEKADYKKISNLAFTCNKNVKDHADENAVVEYFTNPGSKDIWLLLYHDNCVSYRYVFTAAGECHGVASFNNCLAICLCTPTGFSLLDWQVQYVDLDGNIKKQIYYDSDGKTLFKHPVQLASNYSEDVLFVSDREKHAVIAIGSEGEVIYNFTHDTIRSPTGSNVYVACGENVVQIDKHGKKARVILASKSKYITSLCYNRQSRRLAVLEHGRAVTIFTFS